MNEDLIAEIQALSAIGSEEKFSEIIRLLKNSTLELRGKKNPDLQLSASALVFKNHKLFFIEHPYQKELLLPAGHVELGEKPLGTAIREFHEETGFSASESGKLVDVNLINIPYNKIKNEKEHQHIDFRFLLELKEKEADLAELPFFLLDRTEAPDEFKKYYQYKR